MRQVQTKSNDGSNSNGSMRNASGEESPKTYSMKLLLEEVQTLRRRVKELEDDGSAGGRSGPSVDTTAADGQSAAELEVLQLRKELSKVEDEKAAQELDFMNQLSSFSRENQDVVDELRSKLFNTEEELATIKAKKPVVYEGDTAEAVAAVKQEFRDEIEKLEEDLDDVHEELTETRKDNDAMQDKIQSLEMQRNQLLDETTGLRLEIDNEAKVIANLNDEMHEMERNYGAKIERMELEIAQKDELIERHAEEVAEMNDAVIRMEEKKAMLLDEVTDLRMILDREEKNKNDMKKRLDDMTVQKSTTEEKGGAQVTELQTRLEDAEKKVTELNAELETKEKELLSIASSYKTDVARLEESVSVKDAMLEDVRKDYKELAAESEKKGTDMDTLRAAKEELDKELTTTKQRLEDQQKELESLSTQREGYEKRSTECIMEHVAEADEVREKNRVLMSEQVTLMGQLQEQRQTCKTLKAEVAALKARRPQVPRATTQKPSESPLASRKASPPPSPGGYGSVRALAACFEGKGADMPVVPSFGSDANLDKSMTDGGGAAASVDTTVGTSVSPGMSTADVVELEERLAEEIEKNEALEAKLHSQSELVGELRGEIASLAATRSAIQAMSRKEYERQTDLDQEEIRKVRQQFEKTKADLGTEKAKVDELQREIAVLTSERIDLQEQIEEANSGKRSEKQHKYLTGEVNRLRVLLTQEQLKHTELREEHNRRVKELEATIEELNVECDKELDEKQVELDALQQRLDEHIDDIRRLEAEREQLCITMNNTSGARRDELDELQSELMEKTSALKDMSRRCQSLEMQVEHHREHTDELARMRDRVKELEAETGARGAATAKLQQVELDEMRHENTRLRDSVRNITLERRALQEKLNTVVTQKTSTRSTQVLRERNDKLKKEVERLNKKIDRLEGNVTRIAI